MVRPLCINMCLSIPVNEIQRINTQTSSALNPSRDVYQYVVLRFFTFESVEADTCHVKLRINNIKYCTFNPWSDIFNYLLVCVFTFQCVDASTCEQYSNNKNLELSTIKFETHKRGSIINYFISDWNYTAIISGGMNANRTEFISDIYADNVFQQIILFSNLCHTPSSLMIFYSSSA